MAADTTDQLLALLPQSALSVLCGPGVTTWEQWDPSWPAPYADLTYLGTAGRPDPIL